MRRYWAMWASSAVGFLLFLSSVASGQQGSQQQQWQGVLPSSPLLQSSSPSDSSRQAVSHKAQRPAVDSSQLPSGSTEQSSRLSNQPLKPGGQDASRPNVQEVPAVWQPPPPAISQPPAVTSAPETNIPGYLGLNGRDFYRSHFCMHALTIQGVEVVTVEPNSPAARAGLHPAQPLSLREVAVGTVAGTMTLAHATPIAASVVSASGGMNHGDIVLAVAGQRVKTLDEFQRVVAQFGPRTVVYFTVRRGETVLQLPVRLTHWPNADLPLQQAQLSE